MADIIDPHPSSIFHHRRVHHPTPKISKASLSNIYPRPEAAKHEIRADSTVTLFPCLQPVQDAGRAGFESSNTAHFVASCLPIPRTTSLCISLAASGIEIIRSISDHSNRVPRSFSSHTLVLHKSLIPQPCRACPVCPELVETLLSASQFFD